MLDMWNRNVVMKHPRTGQAQNINIYNEIYVIYV